MNVKTTFESLDFENLDKVLYVGGQYQEGAGSTFPITNPATEETIGYGASATAEEIDQAITLANREQKFWQRDRFRTR